MDYFKIFIVVVVILLSIIQQNACSNESSFDTVLRNQLEIKKNPLGLSMENSTVMIEKSSIEPKSRRKRYIAFPEGSSFSVRAWQSMIFSKFVFSNDMFPLLGSILCDTWFCWQPSIHLFQLGY